MYRVERAILVSKATARYRRRVFRDSNIPAKSVHTQNREPAIGIRGYGGAHVMHQFGTSI